MENYVDIIRDIINENPGVGKYGILVALLKCHNYDFQKDGNFEMYISECLTKYDIRVDSGRYYSGKVFLIPVRLEDGLYISNCYDCPFKGWVSQANIIGLTRNPELDDYKDCVCTLNTKIRFTPKPNWVPEQCPRHKLIYEMKEKENCDGGIYS